MLDDDDGEIAFYVRSGLQPPMMRDHETWDDDSNHLSIYHLVC